MTLIRPDTKTVLEYDAASKRTKLYDVAESQARLTAIADELAAIPAAPDDKTLLAWARENYPAVDYSAKRDALEAEQAKLTDVLATKVVSATPEVIK